MRLEKIRYIAGLRMVKTSYGKTYKSSVLYAYSAVMFVACGFLCFGCFNEV